MMRALLILLACCRCACALNPSLDVNQYAHTAWKIRDGFFKGEITSIAQTPDGYLWLGTEFGLVRFDGIRAVPWLPPAGQQIPSGGIVSLVVSRDGRLWIGGRNGLASWKDGKLYQYPEGPRGLDRLYGAELHRTREDAFPLHAGGPGPGLDRGGQRSRGAVFESPSAALPLPRDGLE